MARIDIERFYGEIPQLSDDLLPVGYASQAIDCNLESMALSSFHADTQVAIGGSTAQSAYWTGESWRILSVASPIIDAPVSNDRRYAGRYSPVGGTALNVPSILTFDDNDPTMDESRALAVPAPTEKITSVTVDGTGRTTDSNDLPDPPLQTSLAVYTFVTDLNEESRPSPLSDAFQRQPNSDDLQITIPAVPQAARDRGVNRLRVYVSETIFGQTQFQLLAETTGLTTSVMIAGDTQDEGPLPSTEYDDLPNEYGGFVTMPNGIVVAHRLAVDAGKELRFSEQYKIWAWPTAYERLVDDNVVGLAMFGETLCIMTEGRPYVATGLTPGTIVLKKIDAVAPCTDRHSIVDLGYSAAYSAPRGLTLVSEQGAQIASSNLLSQDQWEAISERIRAGQWDGRYVWSYRNAQGNRASAVIDLTGEQPFLFRLSAPARSWIYREIDSKTFYINASDGNLYQLEGSSGYKPFDWTSGLIQIQTAVGFGVCIVQGTLQNEDGGTIGDGTDLVFEVLHGDTVIGRGTRLNEAFRIKQGRYRDWRLRLRGTAKVTRVTLASGYGELGMN